MHNPTPPNALHVQVCLAPEFNNPELNIARTQVALDFPLADGERTLTSAARKVGVIANSAHPDLMASLTFTYSYDSVTNTLTFVSSDLVSNQATFLSLVPNGTSQLRKQNAYANHDQAQDASLQWSYDNPLTAGLGPALQETVRNANDLVIATAKSLGFNVIVRTPVPVIPAEDYKDYSAVFYQGKFLEFYNPDKVYGSEHQVLHIDSYWHGEIYLNSRECFANVIGSTHDPKHGWSSWIGLWESQFGPANNCSSNGMPHFTCSGNILGGHVVLGKVPYSPPTGANYVFIMPICSAHNNNDNVYMEALQYLKGIALKGYNT